MPNPNYKYEKAPDDFPGTVFDNGNCYKHHLVWWKKRGEVPSKDEVIHHKNEDKSDNRIENLEKLTVKEHVSLHADRGRTYLLIECPECGLKFEREKRKTCLIKANKKADFCSRSCSSIFQRVDPIDTEKMKKYILDEFVKYTN